MNCIFCCIFNHEQYINMFFVLLESIFIYGNLDYNTEILIYTSTLFMNKIKESHLFNNEKIKFEINDTYDDIDKACGSKLDLFNLTSAINYNKILYLDIDIVVKDNINKIFDVCIDDILYTVEEGIITDPIDIYGKSLFGDEINNYNDKTAFSSGILLFNNSEKIKNLFNEIKKDINNRYHFFQDQAFIIYNAFKYNLYNNKILNPLSKIYNINNKNNYNYDNNIILYHFSGGVGIYENKIEKMNNFLNNIEYDYK